MVDESDEDMDDIEDEPQAPPEEEEPEIVESDIELDESDVVEPDNDPPQKVCATCIAVFSLILVFHDVSGSKLNVWIMEFEDGRSLCRG